MDFSALLSGLITDNTVKEVSKKSGASKKDVSSVLTTALPLLLANGSNTSSQQVAEESGVSQSTTNNVLSSAAPMLLNMVGGQNNQSSAAGNIALLGALLGKVDLGKLTSGLMGLVSTNTADEKPKEEATATTSGKKKTGSKKKTDAKKTDSKKTDSKKKETSAAKKTDSKKKTTSSSKKTTSSSKKTAATAKKAAPESTLDKVTGLLGNLLK